MSYPDEDLVDNLLTSPHPLPRVIRLSDVPKIPLPVTKFIEDNPHFEEYHYTLRFAFYCGAEARANGRRNINAYDRSDLADRLGYAEWTEIEPGLREAITAVFYVGWREEGG